jgi:uncharacterized protein
MRLDLRGRAAAGKLSRDPIAFSGELDLSRLSRWGEKPFPEPVSINGEAVYNGDFFELSYTAAYTVRLACARCLAPLLLRQTSAFTHSAMEADEDSEHWEDTVPLRDGQLDVSEMAAADLLLELEGVPLCRPDCRGICPKCGKNLNEGDCACAPDPDPRFAVLREYMEQNRPE